MKTLKNLLICLFCLTILFFVGCSQQSVEETTQNVLSEYRKNLFLGKGSSFVATFTSGEREKDYVMDGKPSNLVDFGVLTIKYDNYTSLNLPKFELKIDKDTFTGELEHNPYDGTFVFDIEKQVSDKDVLSLYLVDFDEYITLDCWSKNWQCDYLKAKDVFTNKYKSEIIQHTVDGLLQAEMYIKIVTDNKEYKNIYWYVLLVCQNGDMFSTLIDVSTGQIVQN